MSLVELCNLGVVVCDGTPVVDPRLFDVIASCPPAQLAHKNATPTPSPMNHERSRRQGKAGKAIDIVTLSRFWKHASSTTRETIQSVAGPTTGLLWMRLFTRRAQRVAAGPPFSAGLPQSTQLATSHSGKHLRTGTTIWSTQGTTVRNAVGQLWSTLSWCLHGCRRTCTCSPRDPPLCCQLVAEKRD